MCNIFKNRGEDDDYRCGVGSVPTRILQSLASGSQFTYK